MSEIWLVGEIYREIEGTTDWAVLGIFDKKEFAEAICYNEWCFVVPMQLNMPLLPGQDKEIPGMYFPKYQKNS